jgi:hypothetical protein
MLGLYPRHDPAHGVRLSPLLRVANVCGASHHVIGPVSEAKLFAAIEAGRTSGFFQAGTQ